MHHRISVNSLCFGKSSPDGQIAKWRELGPRRIGLLASQVFKDRNWVRDVVTEGDYRIATLSHGFHRGVLPDNEADWAQSRDQLSDLIQFGQTVGLESIYMMTGGRGKRSWEEAVAIFREAISPCVDEANAAGIPLLIEPSSFTFGWTHLAHTLSDTIKLAEIAGIGICLDLFSGWYESDLRGLVERALPITRLVQVSDYVCGDYALPARAVPGDGDIPVAQIIEWLLVGGYEHAFDLELLGPRIDAEGHVAATRRAADYVTELLERMGA